MMDQGGRFLLGTVEVQDAIHADDEGALLKALGDVEGSLATADGFVNARTAKYGLTSTGNGADGGESRSMSPRTIASV